MRQWTEYYVTLSNQIGRDGKRRPLGQQMDNEHLDKFTDEQLRQLHDLYTEIQTANEEFTNKDEKS